MRARFSAAGPFAQCCGKVIAAELEGQPHACFHLPALRQQLTFWSLDEGIAAFEDLFERQAVEQPRKRVQPRPAVRNSAPQQIRQAPFHIQLFQIPAPLRMDTLPRPAQRFDHTFQISSGIVHLLLRTEQLAVHVL